MKYEIIAMILTNALIFIALGYMAKIFLNELHTLIFVDLKKIKDENKD